MPSFAAPTRYAYRTYTDALFGGGGVAGSATMGGGAGGAAAAGPCGAGVTGGT